VVFCVKLFNSISGLPANNNVQTEVFRALRNYSATNLCSPRTGNLAELCFPTYPESVTGQQPNQTSESKPLPGGANAKIQAILDTVVDEYQSQPATSSNGFVVDYLYGINPNLTKIPIDPQAILDLIISQSDPIENNFSTYDPNCIYSGNCKPNLEVHPIGSIMMVDAQWGPSGPNSAAYACIVSGEDSQGELEVTCNGTNGLIVTTVQNSMNIFYGGLGDGPINTNPIGNSNDLLEVSFVGPATI